MYPCFGSSWTWDFLRSFVALVSSIVPIQLYWKGKKYSVIFALQTLREVKYWSVSEIEDVSSRLVPISRTRFSCCCLMCLVWRVRQSVYSSNQKIVGRTRFLLFLLPSGFNSILSLTKDIVFLYPSRLFKWSWLCCCSLSWEICDRGVDFSYIELGRANRLRKQFVEFIRARKYHSLFLFFFPPLTTTGQRIVPSFLHQSRSSPRKPGLVIITTIDDLPI